MKSYEFRAIRKSLGLTQRDLGQKLGMGVNLVNEIEKNDPVPLRYEFALRWIELCALEKKRAADAVAMSVIDA